MPSFQLYDVVEAMFREAEPSKFYPGKIVKVYKGLRYDVVFDDGDKIKRVDASRVRKPIWYWLDKAHKGVYPRKKYHHAVQYGDMKLCSGDVVMARLRHTTDRDGEHAYQLLRPRLVHSVAAAAGDGQSSWVLQPYLEGLTSQQNVVLFKAAVASVLEPEARLLQAYAQATRQECPLEETPVERLKRAFQEFTETFESAQ